MQYELSVSRPSPLIDLFKGTCFHTPVASRRSFRSRCSLAGSALTCTLSQSVKWKLMLKFERTFTITRFDGPLCGSLYSNSQWHGRDPSLLSGLGCPKPGQNPRAPCVSNHVLISPCDSGHPGCRGCRCFCRAKKAGDCTRGVLRNFIQGHFPVPPSFPRPPFPPPPVPAAFSPTFHSSPPCPPFRLRALSGSQTSTVACGGGWTKRSSYRTVTLETALSGCSQTRPLGEGCRYSPVLSG